MSELHVCSIKDKKGTATKVCFLSSLKIHKESRENGSWRLPHRHTMTYKTALLLAELREAVPLVL